MRELGDDPAVVGLLAEVSATPVVADAVAGRLGGFASWTLGLPDCAEVDLVTGLAETEYLARVASARQVCLVQEFCSRRCGTAWVGGRARGSRDEFTADHLAAALGVSLRSATNRIHEAEALRDYPRILAALGAGLVSMAGVRAFLREVSGLDLVQHPGHAAAVETHVLNQAGEPFLPDLGTWTAEAHRGAPVRGRRPVDGCGDSGSGHDLDPPSGGPRGQGRRPEANPEGPRRSRRSSSVGVAGSGWPGSGRGCRRRKPRPGTSGSTAKPGGACHDPDLDPGSCGDSLPLDGEALSLDAVRAQVFFDLLMNDTSVAPGPVNLTVLVDAEGVATTPSLGPVSAADRAGVHRPRDPHGRDESARSSKSRSPARGSTPTVDTTTPTKFPRGCGASCSSATGRAATPAAPEPRPVATSTTPSPGRKARPAPATCLACAVITTG